MIRVIALDVSTSWSGVALLELEGSETPTLVGEVGLLVRDSHASHLLGLLDRLVVEACWARSSVDLYAATRGPGSFTGVRVGLGTVRGLGLAAGRPSIGIGTLEAMAEAVGPAERERVPLLCAGRGDVYGARYDATSSPPLEVVPAWVGPPERALLLGASEPLVFGSGALAHEKRLRAAGLRGRLGRTPTSIAAGAARVALARARAGAADGEGLSPVYVRPADAEIGRGLKADEPA